MDWTFDDFKTDLDALSPVIREKALEIAQQLVKERCDCRGHHKGRRVVLRPGRINKKIKIMIQILEQTEGNIIATKATGKLTETDYDKLLPILNNKQKQYPKIRWYFEMEDFEGWELKAFWQDLKFDAEHARDFEKVVLVGEKEWEKWMTNIMEPFTSAEVKYFDTQQREEAKNWIKS